MPMPVSDTLNQTAGLVGDMRDDLPVPEDAPRRVADALVELRVGDRRP